MTLTVAITGATGFIGRPLSLALIERGHRVRAFVRHRATPLDSRIESVPWNDLHDTEALLAGCADADAVVHLAGRAHIQSDTSHDPENLFHIVNVDGTRRVMEAAVQERVKRAILVGSVKAIGDSNETPWTENEPAHPTDAYGRSKLEAERAAREVAAGTGLHLSVLRLPLVYGPGATANVRRLLSLVEGGWPLPFGSVRNRRSMIYVDNAVSALVALLETEPSVDGTFLASDGRDLSTPELIRLVARALGRPARLVSVPAGVLRAAGTVGDLCQRWVTTPISSAAIERLTGSLAVHSERLFDETGWRPTVSVEDGWRATAQWYLASQGRA